MQRCPYCNVTVAGHKKCCPLCGGPLTGTPEPDTEVFPAVEKPRFSSGFALRLLALLAIAVSAVCILINFELRSHVWWSLFVAAGAGCVWLAAAIGVTYRRDLPQNVGWQVALIPALSVLWDLWTGWRGWSLDFVLPCVCVAGMLMILVLALCLRLPVQTFAGSFVGTCLLGLLPLLLVIGGKVGLALPSLICSGLAIILLAALLLFQWQAIKAEIIRRLHL